MNKWQIKQKSNVITNAQMTCAGISGAQGSWACSENEAQADSSSRGWKDFIVEKRKTAWWGMQGTWKQVVPWIRVGIGFYSLFVHCLRTEMLSDADRRFLGRSVSLTSCGLSFKSCPPQWAPRLLLGIETMKSVH
jgi:hypothetical protein